MKLLKFKFHDVDLAVNLKKKNQSWKDFLLNCSTLPVQCSWQFVALQETKPVQVFQLSIKYSL